MNVFCFIWKLMLIDLAKCLTEPCCYIRFIIIFLDIPSSFFKSKRSDVAALMLTRVGFSR